MLLPVAKFDLAKTALVVELLSTPRERRNDAWQESFFDAIVDASLASTPEQVITGPDGFGYFVLDEPPVRAAFTSFCV